MDPTHSYFIFTAIPRLHMKITLIDKQNNNLFFIKDPVHGVIIVPMYRK